MAKRGARAYGINEDFFRKSTRERDYVLGILFPCFIYSSSGSFVIRTKKRELLEIISSKLESKHAIIEDNRENKNSYFLQIKPTPYLLDSFERFGLLKGKKERRVPEHVKVKGLGHFLRGFIDAKGHVKIVDRELSRHPVLRLSFNEGFLFDIESIFSEKAGVFGTLISNNYLRLGKEDTQKAKDLIYRDWKFIEGTGIYLPETKVALDFYQGKKKKLTNKQNELREKIKRAKKLLLQGKRSFEIYEEVGYRSVYAFSNSFEHYVGMRPTHFVKKEIEKRERKRLKRHK